MSVNIKTQKTMGGCRVIVTRSKDDDSTVIFVVNEATKEEVGIMFDANNGPRIDIHNFGDTSREFRVIPGFQAKTVIGYANCKNEKEFHFNENGALVQTKCIREYKNSRQHAYRQLNARLRGFK